MRSESAKHSEYHTPNPHPLSHFSSLFTLHSSLLQSMTEILYIGLTQAFFAGLMIATKRNPHVADRILAAWLFLIAIEMVFALVNETYIELYQFVFIPFTYGPLLYLYVKFLTIESHTFKWQYWMHFIPFIAVFTTAIVFHGRPVMRLDNFFANDLFLSFRLIYGLSFFISITTYSIIAFVLISRHQKNIRNIYSSTSTRINLSWLKVVSISFYVTYVLVFIVGVYVIFKQELPYDPTIVSYFGLTLFAFAFSVYGIKQPEIFYGYYMEMKSSGILKKEPANGQSKYTRSGLKSQDADKYLNRLLKHMDEKKPYLDVDLTIHDLSDALKIPRHYLTQVINEKLNRNFYQFINEYRVEEVKRLLQDPDYRKYTFTTIAFEAGFNSKSSFNSVFKETVGMTPSQYKVKFLDNRLR
jgi:AraC-like DNA-binding protein